MLGCTVHFLSTVFRLYSSVQVAEMVDQKSQECDVTLKMKKTRKVTTVFVLEAGATVALNTAAAVWEFKAILVSTTPPTGMRCSGTGGVHLSCIFSRIGTIMSNLGLFAGSSFMQIFISLQIWGDMPGGIVGLKPSRAT